ncbi:hypothetical protein RND81_05G019400 [Saponaria officinalis]|uniref:Uncharacterized protein n=1 Tax=Saponaria officinalis TaxID=3572 RepID=A0AAW1KQF9_SAPOF
MLIALSAKNKLGFVDGTVEKPAAKSTTSKAWQRCNDLVFSWILNSVSDEIGNSILYCETTKKALDELEERFGQTNGAQLYGIHKKLNDSAQGNDNISVCVFACVCGAAEKQKKFQQDQRVVQFLMCLNDSYSVIRGAILMQNPLPSLGVVYNNLLQEERQREIQSSNNQNNSQFRGNEVKCNYCKRPGHTIDKCRKLHKEDASFDAGSINSALCSQFKKFLKQQQQQHGMSDPDTSASANFVNVDANFAGNSSQPNVFNFSNSTWIVDSGATDHMCSCLDLFSDIQTLPKLAKQLHKGSSIWRSRSFLVNPSRISMSFNKDLALLPFLSDPILLSLSILPLHGMLARQHRLPFNDSYIQTTKAFDLIHIDLWGSYPIQTYNGYKYFTRTTWTHFLSCKSNAFDFIQNFIALVQTQFQKKIKAIRSNNALKLGSSNATRNFLNKNVLGHMSHKAGGVRTLAGGGVSATTSAVVVERGGPTSPEHTAPLVIAADNLVVDLVLIYWSVGLRSLNRLLPRGELVLQ